VLISPFPVFGREPGYAGQRCSPMSPVHLGMGMRPMLAKLDGREGFHCSVGNETSSWQCSLKPIHL
jgi:hypothetical protein